MKSALAMLATNVIPSSLGGILERTATSLGPSWPPRSCLFIQIHTVILIPNRSFPSTHRILSHSFLPSLPSLLQRLPNQLFDSAFIPLLPFLPLQRLLPNFLDLGFQIIEHGDTAAVPGIQS